MIILAQVQQDRDNLKKLCEEAYVALRKYGQHYEGCPRQNMKALCTCGFSRLIDEGALFDQLKMVAEPD